MKLTNKTVTERMWKNKCLPFLILGLTIPLCCWAMCAFTLAGLILGVIVFVPFCVLFLREYLDYWKVKRGKYIIYRQKCTSIYSVTNTVDGDPIKDHYSVFGNIGEYKHKGTDTHIPAIRQGDTYYLVVLEGNTKISILFSAEEYTIDTSVYTTEDQQRYIPMPTQKLTRERTER